MAEPEDSTTKIILEEVKELDQEAVLDFSASNKKRDNPTILDIDDTDMTRQNNRYAYDSFVAPSNSFSNTDELKMSGEESSLPEGSPPHNESHTKQGQASFFIEAEVVPEEVIEEVKQDKVDEEVKGDASLVFDISKDAEKDIDSEDITIRPQRTQSHFVELNSKNEDSLLEEIAAADAIKELDNMLLLDDDDEEEKGKVIQNGEDELLLD